jgi:hypothetical protein
MTTSSVPWRRPRLPSTSTGQASWWDQAGVEPWR